jgi:hypothetical protein
MLWFGKKNFEEPAKPKADTATVLTASNAFPIFEKYTEYRVTGLG